MEAVQKRGGQLYCEGASLARIAAQAGTPVYIYSTAALRTNYRALVKVFRGVPNLLCYAVKANSSLAILRLLKLEGSGFDIVSGGELRRVLRIGGDPEKVVFSGVGKTRAELALAIRRRVGTINVESAAELEMVAEEARRLRRVARVAVRVNPDVDPHTHRHISTGRQQHKFGVHWREAGALCRRAAALDGVRFAGLGCHIGSQITRLGPFELAVRRLEKLADGLVRDGIAVAQIDFGGGVGIRYQQENTIPLAKYAQVLKRLTRKLKCRLLIEPGRVIVGPAGVLVSRVVLEKISGRQRFVVLDVAMNDFLRPALYGAKHRISAVKPGRGKKSRADVVGPVCETADCFGRGVLLPPLAEGDLVALHDTGAYGFVLSSNYNSRPRSAEVLVSGRRWRVIRKRERWNDEIRGEIE